MRKLESPSPLAAWLRDKGVKSLLDELEKVERTIIPVFIVNPPDYPGAVWPGGKIKSKKTLQPNFSDSAKLHKFTVPVGKRWIVHGGLVYRDTSATLNVNLYNAADEVIWRVLTASAGTGTSVMCGNTTYPNGVRLDFPMKEGWYLACEFSENQDTGAYCSLFYTEVDE